MLNSGMQQAEVPVKLYSYVVEHDEGRAPNPYFRVCTLCRCKFRSSSRKPRNVVELAKEGDWIVGTGGASRRSSGHGTIVYAMRVDEKLTREQYYTERRFARKRLGPQGDNEKPTSDFERRKQFSLVSRHFYYFGERAIDIPPRFRKLEKKGPAFRSDFPDICGFVEWLEANYEPGRHGKPCKPRGKSRGTKKCKSSC
jgi:hypothetical protein